MVVVDRHHVVERPGQRLPVEARTGGDERPLPVVREPGAGVGLAAPRVRQTEDTVGRVEITRVVVGRPAAQRVVRGPGIGHRLPALDGVPGVEDDRGTAGVRCVTGDDHHLPGRSRNLLAGPGAQGGDLLGLYGLRRPGELRPGRGRPGVTDTLPGGTGLVLHRSGLPRTPGEQQPAGDQRSRRERVSVESAESVRSVESAKRHVRAFHFMAGSRRAGRAGSDRTRSDRTGPAGACRVCRVSPRSQPGVPCGVGATKRASARACRTSGTNRGTSPRAHGPATVTGPPPDTPIGPRTAARVADQMSRAPGKSAAAAHRFLLPAGVGSGKGARTGRTTAAPKGVHQVAIRRRGGRTSRRACACRRCPRSAGPPDRPGGARLPRPWHQWRTCGRATRPS